MTNLRYISYSILLFSGLFSCTDVIDIDADFQKQELVVDAWLNQQSVTQTIYLTLTQDYFENTLPPGVTNAVVVLTNETQGRTFDFTHTSKGTYEWIPDPADNIGTDGDIFSLAIDYDAWSYEAQSILNAVPPVDSIVYELKDGFGEPEGIYAQFYARDLPGIGNAYWIKTYKNDTFLNKANEMNISIDGTFTLGSNADALVFIPTIREAINRVPDPDTDDNGDVPPYAIGDSIRVEIHSITLDAYRFLSIAQEQMTNGDAGLFALPVTNSPTNISALQADAPAALGLFCVSSVSSKEVMVE